MTGPLQAVWELLLLAVLLAILAGFAVLGVFLYMTVYLAIRGRSEARRG